MQEMWERMDSLFCELACWAKKSKAARKTTQLAMLTKLSNAQSVDVLTTKMQVV